MNVYDSASETTTNPIKLCEGEGEKETGSGGLCVDDDSAAVYKTIPIIISGNMLVHLILV